jgi:Fur family ferric uptake transcriptional regulator
LTPGQLLVIIEFEYQCHYLKLVFENRFLGKGIDVMKREQEILAGFLRQKGMKQTGQRQKILDIFMANTKHVSADELHATIRQSDPRIGFSTVYRTLRLFTECGLAREVNFGDGRARFERALDKGQHGHIICTSCGRTEEFSIGIIEKSMRRVSSQLGFKVLGHRLEVYGLCKRCQKTAASYN